MGISTAWYQGLDDKEKKDMELLVKSSGLVLRRLNEILDIELAKNDTSGISVSNYDTPSWSHKQAHYNGARSTLTLFKKIVSI